MNRDVRVHTGAGVPTRANSTWAGSWSGVLTATDFPSRPLMIPWENGAYQTGRIQLVQHYLGHAVLTTANVYGFVSGYSFPDAKLRTEQLLLNLTRELVIGGKGPRSISGDFNHEASSLEQVAIWQRHGWMEVQEAARCWWGREPTMTCKGATQRDFIFLSPEALALLYEVRVQDDFAEHSTVIAGLKFDLGVERNQSWPLPATIPWGKIDIERWQMSASPDPRSFQNSTQWFRSFSKDLESSLDGFVTGTPGGQLPAHCYGRAKRLTPSAQPACAVGPKLHRPGEEPLRHGMLCLEVKQWYKQLRRLQSLLHSLKGGKPHAEACAYRLQLWRAILGSSGFHPNFAAWYPLRLVRLQGMPSQLPLQLPTTQLAERLFEDFRDNFRRFETWHSHQRTTVLKARYEESRSQLFKDLRDPCLDQADILVYQHHCSVLAHDTPSHQVLLDVQIPQKGVSTWLVDGVPVDARLVGPDTLHILSDCVLSEGTELEHTQVVSDTKDILHDFEDFWCLRWNKTPDVAHDWGRLQAFANAYLPNLRIQLPPISVEVWKDALRRYKKRAARGPDAYSHYDLRHMPRAYMQQLLDFLHEIERGSRQWPEQWTIGFVLSLLKPDRSPESVNAFRPIVILSVIYRTWASVRARQLLSALEPLMPSQALGYMPGREATSLWYQLEALIELSVQSGEELAGFSTDIVKAFENLPRQPLFEVASGLGFPAAVLRPWSHFLSQLQRRFVVRQTVGKPIRASSGFPEGDPLSPCAMCVAVLIYHRYMEVYEPRLSAFSYVDNWAHTAGTSAIVARGICLTQCVCDMLALELDNDKSYVWGLSGQMRKELQAVGLPVATHARELGGFLTFQGRTRNRELVQRCLSLGPLFQKLRRSLAPLPQKIQSLAAKFWARALHGVAACPLAPAHLTSLRAKAVQALQVGSAGLNPLLRLSLSGCLVADPGFYQLWCTIKDARRMMRKHPDVVVSWRQFMQSFDGRMQHGPFSKLLSVLSQIGWHIAKPPTVIDHTGLCHDMLMVPKALLRRLLEHAWLQHVSTTVQHRQHLHDLCGLEPDLIHLDVHRMLPVNLARLRALQSGAFLFGSEHAVHDRSLNGQCETCAVPDTRQHRACECPVYAELRPSGVDISAKWEATASCVRNHLLPPANPHLSELRAHLHQLPDCTGHFVEQSCLEGRQHVFTDGSCLQWDFPCLALAAWAVVNANTGLVLNSAPVHGLTQSAPRAETLAVLSAIKWAAQVGLPLTIWSDALQVVSQLQTLLDGGTLVDDGANHDLWVQVRDLLPCFPEGAITVQHVHSHLDSAKLTSPFEDWVKRWNDTADRAAVTANLNRSTACTATHERALKWFQQTAQELRFWRGIYFGIAELTQGQRHMQPAQDLEEVEFPDHPAIWLDRDDQVIDRIPLNWGQLTNAACPDLPSDFVRDLLQAFLFLDSGSHQACTVSWIELLFLLDGSSSLTFPVKCPETGRWRLAQDVPFRPFRTHAAVQLRIVRKVLTSAFQVAGIQDVLCGEVDVTCYGVSMPMGGLLMGSPPNLIADARRNLTVFSRARLIRVMADLARPI